MLCAWPYRASDVVSSRVRLRGVSCGFAEALFNIILRIDGPILRIDGLGIDGPLQMRDVVVFCMGFAAGTCFCRLVDWWVTSREKNRRWPLRNYRIDVFDAPRED